MKTRFLVGIVFVVGLCLSLPSQSIFSVFSAGLEPVYAQGSATTKFWVFDGHMHPTSSRRRGNIGDPNPNYRFTLPKAFEGGLGAGFFNSGVDEFYETNRLAVKEVLRQFDRFYHQIGLYPDQIGVARSAQEVRALRRENKIAAVRD